MIRISENDGKTAMTAQGPSPEDRSSASPGPSNRQNYPPPNVPPVPQPPPPSMRGKVQERTNTAMPATYWPLSIIVFLLFWLLFGAIAMYYSAQVSTRWRYGDVMGARQASKSALIINLIGFAFGTVIWLFVIAA